MIRAMISFSWPVLKPVLITLGVTLAAGVGLGLIIAG